jgi:GSCFA family
MKFSTEIPVERSNHSIHVKDELVLMGSCFAQEIGEWFQTQRFRMVLNPNGIIFHPSVLARILKRALNQAFYSNAEWTQHNGLFHSFDHHGSCSKARADELTRVANRKLTETHDALLNADTLIITWGSAWGYRWNATGEWVANCHKIPQHGFTKELVEASSIESEWTEVLQLLRQHNPKVNVIFSVSPVRYWRDGAHGNQLSKAHLLIAASRISQASAFAHYFPSYEILLDELRDYRFYAHDMLHPSKVAVDYIIEKFQDMFFAEGARNYVRQMEPLLKFIGHRPLHISNEEWGERLREKEAAIKQLRNTFT